MTHDRTVARRNPLLAAWRTYQEPIALDWALMSTDPEAWQRRTRQRFRDVHASMRAFQMRDHATRRWAWAIPTAEAIQTIAKYAPIVEVGAGTGYWARLLRDVGVTVRAYDRHPPPHARNGWHRKRRRFAPVLEGGARKAKQFPDHALFLCWPPMSSMAADALRLYRGAHVIYIGEGAGGCTADAAFFAALERGWVEVEGVALPQWEGIHDRLEVWRRK